MQSGESVMRRQAAIRRRNRVQEAIWHLEAAIVKLCDFDHLIVGQLGAHADYLKLMLAEMDKGDSQ